MESFSIVCTTCGASLRIRDQRLLGQIVACPKCKGMVLVATGGQAPLQMGDAEVDSEAVTRDNVADPGALSGKLEGSSGSGINSTKGWLDDEWSPDQVPDQFSHDQLADIDSTKAARVSSDRSTAKYATASTLPGNSGQVDGAVPPIAWQSESSAKLRQVAAVGAIATIGLIFSAAIFWFVIRSWLASHSTTGQQASANQPAIEDPVAVKPPESDLADTTPENTTSVGETIPSEGVAATDSSAALEPETAPDVSIPPADPPNDLVKEPLFPDQPVMGEGSASDEDQIAVELPASLRQFTEIIDLNSTESNSPEPTGPAPPATEELKIQFPQMAVADSAFPPPADPIDVRARGKMGILGFASNAQPLDRVLRMIGQLAGIPIELNMVAFDLTGINISVPITLKEKETEAAALLVKAVQEAGCTIQIGSDSIVRVIPGPTAIDETLRKVYSLDDFEGQIPVSSDDFLRLLGSAEGVTVNVEAGSLVVDGQTDQRLRAALVLEAFRMARKQTVKLDETRLTRWIIRLNSQSPGDVADWPDLPDHEVGFESNQAYGVDLILGDLARDAGAGLAIDWSSCWQQGFTPAASSLPWYRGKKSHQVADQVMRPFGLIARAPAKDVWWVGTEKAYLEMPLVAVLDAEFSGDDLLARIAKAIDRPVDETPAVLDPISKKAIVQLPRYVLRNMPTILSK